MALFDPLHRRLVVRVVYDGPAFAGKTTNITQLCHQFPVERRSEIYTPGALKGRTMFFDWLEIDAGTLSGHPVRCQLLSVPGQTLRSYRRRPLIKSADTVVFVCDSSPEQLDDSKHSYRLLQRYLKERPEKVPFLVQANKQDAPGAFSPRQLAEQLRIPSEVPILPARARSGEGVRDTIIAAVRSAVRYTQARVAEVGLMAISGAPQTADDLFGDMLELEDTPDESAADDDDEESPETRVVTEPPGETST